MDKEKMEKYAGELIKDFTLIVASKKPRCGEVLGGAIAAAAHILVIVATRISKGDQAKALELVTTAISVSFKLVHQCEEELREEGYRI